MNKMARYKGSNAQSDQESFVLNMLNWKTNGYYLEIGAFDPFITSNTSCLETEFAWSGIGVEIREECVINFKTRKNPCIAADATTINYLELLKQHNAPKRIDYLQIDIDPPMNNLLVLQAMPLEEYRFSVITFEHDLYLDEQNKFVKDTARNIFEDYGYKLVVENVKHEWRAFEDWYVDPSVISEDLWGSIISNNIDSRELFIGRD